MMIDWLLEILPEVWKTKQVPSEWKKAILVPVHKQYPEFSDFKKNSFFLRRLELQLMNPCTYVHIKYANSAM